MPGSYGIAGIGNGLGTFGLGSTGSYFDPYSMMGANPYGMSGYSPYAMGGLGMMGMYNPTFMAQMNQMQQNLEMNQLNHSSAMHNLINQNKVEAFRSEDRAFFEKAMVDTGVNKGITNLAEKVREGDGDGICQMYDELKQTIYTKYSDYFQQNRDIDPNDYVTNFIEILYNKTLAAQGDTGADLRTDIKKYGQTAFEHGFWKSLHGKDYPEKYSEETLEYLFGTPVANRAGKERMAKMGSGTEKVAEGVVAMGTGAVALPAVATAAKWLKGSKNKNCFGRKWALIGAAAALAGDVLWQMSRA